MCIKYIWLQNKPILEKQIFEYILENGIWETINVLFMDVPTATIMKWWA